MMRFLSRFTLRRQIGLIIFLGLFLGAGLFAFLSLQAINQSTKARLQERLAMARLVADQKARTLESALHMIEAAAASGHLTEGAASPQQALESLGSSLAQLGLSVTGLFLLTETEVAVWGAPGLSEEERQSLVASPTVKKTLETGESTISSLVSTPLFQQPEVLLSSRVNATALSAPKALVAAIDPGAFKVSGFAQPINLGETGYVEIVDSNGIVLARTEPGTPPLYFERSDHPERFAALIASEKATTGTCHRCHEGEQPTERKRDVLAFAPIPRASWGVVVRQSEEEALAPTRELRQRLIVSGAVLLAISLGLVWAATSDPISRLTALRKASSRMAEGDLTTPIPVRGGDEIGSLAQTLESTRGKLKSSYDEIEQRSKELASLLSISQTLTTNPDFTTLLQAMTAKATEAVGAEAGSLFLYEAEAGKLVLGGAVGIELSLESSEIIIPASAPDVEKAPLQAQSSLPQGLSPELAEMASRACDGLLSTLPPNIHPSHILSTPLVCKGQYMGTLMAMNFSPSRAFTEAERRLLHNLGGEIAMGVDNAQLSIQAQEARVLRETDRLKSEFISTVSHELRTPLTSIKGYVSSLLRQDVRWDEETKAEFLRSIDEKADELRDLIDKLLQMARVEAGVLQVRKEPVLVNHLVRKMVAEIAPRNPRHSFSADFPAPFPVVETDSADVEIVLRNLIDNAVKYSPQGGRITIAGRVDNGKVIVSVSDEGIGIPAKEIGMIFQRFYRVQSSLTWRISGSGLGLSVAKALIETHSGEIWAESEEGQGSTFYFTLPMGSP